MNDNKQKSNRHESSDNQIYAQQWINFLQKKNARLNIIWPMFLTLSIALAGALIFQYQGAQKNALKVENMTTKIASLKNALDQTEADLKKYQSEVKRLKQEKDQAIIEKQALITDKQGVINQLNQATENLQAQKIKIGELQDALTQAQSEYRKQLEKLKLNTEGELAREKERQNLTDELASLNAELEDLKKNKELYETKLAKEKKSRQALKVQIKNRKAAFDALARRNKDISRENARLSGLLDKASSSLDQKTKYLNQLNRQHAKLQSEYSSIQKLYRDLKKNFDNMMKPITPSKNNISKMPDVIPEPVTKAKTKTPGKKVGAPAEIDYDQLQVPIQ